MFVKIVCKSMRNLVMKECLNVCAFWVKHTDYIDYTEYSILTDNLHKLIFTTSPECG